MEIERKFLLNELPDKLETYKHIGISQGYISAKPVIRIRRKSTSDNTAYILTVKSSGLMAHQEYELNLTKEEYDNLCEKVSGNIITKTRYIIPMEDNLTLELDIFEDQFKGLIMGEIEFPDEETANSYTADSMFSKEVTYDTRFHNSTMSSMSEAEIRKFIMSL